MRKRPSHADCLKIRVRAEKARVVPCVQPRTVQQRWSGAAAYAARLLSYPLRFLKRARVIVNDNVGIKGNNFPEQSRFS